MHLPVLADCRSKECRVTNTIVLFIFKLKTLVKIKYIVGGIKSKKKNTINHRIIDQPF